MDLLQHHSKEVDKKEDKVVVVVVEEEFEGIDERQQSKSKSMRKRFHSSEHQTLERWQRLDSLRLQVEVVESVVVEVEPRLEVSSH